jgi:hypothetical protein
MTDRLSKAWTSHIGTRAMSGTEELCWFCSEAGTHLSVPESSAIETFSKLAGGVGEVARDDDVDDWTL